MNDIWTLSGKPIMRHFLASCLLFALAIPCQAQGDKLKPNTLTPKEIADGWILLFDGETMFGWRGNTNLLKVKDGVLELAGVGAGSIETTSIFSDFDLSFDYHLLSGVASVVVQNSPAQPPGKGLMMASTNPPDGRTLGCDLTTSF
jgi:hypothetical protein